jgi:hypothetical protein
MMAGIGDIVTRLTVDRRDFEKGLTGAGRDVQRFSGAVKSAGGSSKTATMALLELSRGAEDAASQFGTLGLAGALRGSMNNLSAMATMLNPMAGVIVGVGAAIASILIPRLMEMKTAADLAKEAVGSLDDALKSVSEVRETGERGSGLIKSASGLDEQKGRVASARGEVADIEEVIRVARLGQDMARTTGDDDLLDELTKQIDEASKRLVKSREKLATEERLLADGTAAERIRMIRHARRPGADEVFNERGINIAGERTFNQRRKIDDLYFRPEREESARRQSAVANYEQFAMQRSLLSGLGGRLSSLQMQRQAMAMGGQAFRNPEATQRGNAVDRIIEIAQAKREAKDEVWRKSQLEKLDKQIELTEKLIEEVKNGDNGGLKPAGVG